MRHGTCIHYTGLRSGNKDCCKAGVNYYQTFDGKKPGIVLRMPCIEFMERPKHGRGTYIKPEEESIQEPVDRRGETVIPCSLRLEPTEEQVQESRRESERLLTEMTAGLKVASQWRVKPKPKTDRREVVTCPICKGNLHLFQSAYNGHVHGKCETKDCLAWME